MAINSSALFLFGFVAGSLLTYITFVENEWSIMSEFPVLNRISSSAYCIHSEDFGSQTKHFRKAFDDRRRAIFNSSIDMRGLQMVVVPQISCPTAVRLGRVGDGGKWACNPWRAPRACVALSFTIDNQVSFESDLYDFTGNRCKIHCFDSNQRSPALFDPFNGTFRPWAISEKSEKSKNRYTLADVVETLGIKRIDFLKIDVDQSEYGVFRGFFSSELFRENRIFVCQLFVELHIQVERWIELQTNFEKFGFLMFYKEANTFCEHCHEYSYIHRNCTKDYQVHGKPFGSNFIRI